MGNSPSQAPLQHGVNEETNWFVSPAPIFGPGLGMLMGGAVAAGAALLAFGAWELLSQLLSGDAADTNRDEAEMRGTETVKSDEGDRGGVHHLEDFQRPSSGNRGDELFGGYQRLEDIRQRPSPKSRGDELFGGYQRLEDIRQRPSPRSRGELSPSPYLNAPKQKSRQKAIKILSYNVWPREDVNVKERMQAIGNLIMKHSPDLICFQEVTPKIYEIFESSKLGTIYSFSLSTEKASRRKYFPMQMSKLPANFDRKHLRVSSMKRELCMAEVDVGMRRKLVFAACHLVSPKPHEDNTFSTERVALAKQALKLLKNHSNVVFGGDMNWSEEVDGSFPLPHGWVDAWEELRPGEDGWTFDTRANKMLSHKPPLQKRLDRFLCCLEDFRVGTIRMIGTEAIPELSSEKRKVLPSDHFGLLLTIYRL